MVTILVAIIRRRDPALLYSGHTLGKLPLWRRIGRGCTLYTATSHGPVHLNSTVCREWCAPLAICRRN